MLFGVVLVEAGRKITGQEVGKLEVGKLSSTGAATE